jgi:hypothetical protein
VCKPNKKAHRFAGGLFDVSLNVGLRESPPLDVMPMVAMGAHEISE